MQVNLANRSETNNWESEAFLHFDLPKRLETAFCAHKTHCICMVLTMKIGRIGLVRHPK